MLGALLYIAIVGAVWRLGVPILGPKRALIPLVLVVLSQPLADSVLSLSLPALGWDIANLAAVVLLPVPVVYLLGELGAKVSRVKHRLRPLVFGAWCVAVWGLLALYLSGNSTYFTLI